ncbi:MAG: prepilin-type N-terminal cleavage/methylation domain-containing protein [Oscillospiraceae bacterium]|nr:prepilin-type N-terminal cleavage/methylation domain-containing protein [Oscillospiraceae bacterium]
MNYFKRLFSKRNNGGFTLIEVVISVGLLGILLVAMTAFVSPILQASNDTQTDIRANILAETIESYIDRSVKVAKYISIFTDVDNKADVLTDPNLTALEGYLTDPSYEIRCIGINWMDDERTNEQKYMLNLWKVTPGSGNHVDISAPNKVFDECFYEGLFPKVIIEPVSGAPTIKITLNVYNNDLMTDGNEAMIGDGYIQLLNLMYVESSKVTDYLKIKSKGGSSEHPDTYIFYVARKYLS